MNRKKKFWRKSIAFGIASAIAIVLTYIKRPVDINYAGSKFTYNLTFFFPLFLLSFILGIVSILYFIRYLRDKEIERNRIAKIVLPFDNTSHWISFCNHDGESHLNFHTTQNKIL